MLILSKIFVSMFAIPEKKIIYKYFGSTGHFIFKSCLLTCMCEVFFVLMGGGMRQAHVLLHICKKM